MGRPFEGESVNSISMVHEAYGVTEREQANKDLEALFSDVRTDAEFSDVLSRAGVFLTRSDRDATQAAAYARDFCEPEGELPGLTLRNIATPLRAAAACVLSRKNVSAAVRKGVARPFDAGRLELPGDVNVINGMVRSAPSGISHLDGDDRTPVPRVVSSIADALRADDFSRAAELAAALPEGFGLRSAVVDAVTRRENRGREVPSA